MRKSMRFAAMVAVIMTATVLMACSKQETSPPVVTEVDNADITITSPAGKSNPTGTNGEREAIIYAIKDIVVNPAGTGGSRFLSVSFGFELASSELESIFAAEEAKVRDALITILSSKTVAQLTDAKQKEIVRYQIRKRVSKVLGSEELVGVYFTDFVLQ